MTAVATQTAPLGLDDGPEVWIGVDHAGTALQCYDVAAKEIWVASARSEETMQVVWARLTWPTNADQEGSHGWGTARTTEADLRGAIEDCTARTVKGWIVFGPDGKEIARERVVE